MKARLFLPVILIASASAAPPGLEAQRMQLARSEAEARLAARRSKFLEQQAAGERNAAAKAAQQEAAVAARITGAEADIAAAGARVAIADRRLAAGRARLAERQAPVLRLVAALQSLARRPSALALVRPGSTADIVHVRAALGALAPVVAARTTEVRDEIAGVRRLRTNAGRAVQGLRDGRGRLQSERLALVRMEGEHRLRGRDLDRRALTESDRAIALGEQARDLVDRMETTTADVATGAALAALPGPLPRPVREGLPAAPAAPRFTLPPYVLPAPGRVVAGLGELSNTGVRARGLTLATPPDAPVVAPAAGRVLFARSFRGYGDVIIIDHGQGWSSAVTGLAAVSVKPGDTVTQGALLGRAAAGSEAQITIELRRRGVPVDITQLIG